MSDNHRGLPHDLPEYVPNWPVPVKVRARVFKGIHSWMWAHDCPRKFGAQVAIGHPSQPEAFEAALKHARGCW